MMDHLSVARGLADSVAKWRDDHEDTFAIGRGPERVPEVNELRRDLAALGVPELTYFEEGLDCIKYAQAPRAAIVLGWTGFIDLLQQRIARDNFVALNAILKTDFRGVHKREKRITSVDQLRKSFDDALLLTAGRKLGLYPQKVFTQLDAMRDERNNCAHVEEYRVSIRVALGFYAKLISYLPNVL